MTAVRRATPRAVRPAACTSSRRGPGRPRDPEIERAVLQAGLDLLAERGIKAVTHSAVARRAGVARATVYLRWPTHDDLVANLVRAGGGGSPYPLSGDLATDIDRGLAFIGEVTAGPHFIPLLPDLIAAVLSDPPRISFDSLAPNRERLAAEYEALAGEQGFDPAIEPHLPLDLMLGAALVYIYANRAAPPTAYLEQLAAVITRGLRADR